MKHFFVNLHPVKKEVWSCPCPCHGGIWENRGTASLIVNFHASWTWVVNYTPWLLHPQKEPSYPLKRRLGGHQPWSGRFWARKSLLHLLGFKPQTIQSVASHYTDCYPSSTFHGSVFIVGHYQYWWSCTVRFLRLLLGLTLLDCQNNLCNIRNTESRQGSKSESTPEELVGSPELDTYWLPRLALQYQLKV